MDRRPPSVLLIAAHDTTSVCSCHFYLNAKIGDGIFISLAKSYRCTVFTDGCCNRAARSCPSQCRQSIL